MALERYKAKRDLKVTPEPDGIVHKGTGALQFVVQKHDASHLHYDFRLELDGVLKSWAVPKGPSMNPADKRLAVQVEDHPYSYKDFEGTIPEGHYGAGKVIVWDTGTYTSPKNFSLQKQLKTGHMEITLQGKKLQGDFDLVRLKDGKNWLLMKRHDEHSTTKDIRKKDHSVLSEKTLTVAKPKKGPMPHQIKPMLATLTEKVFDDEEWIFEIKWDGYRAIAEVEKGKVKLYSRNFLDFSKRYATITKALGTIKHDVVLDGEIVALDKKGVSKFQLLQEYMEKPVDLTYQVFDLLYMDGVDLRGMPLIERKKLLEMLLPKKDVLKYSDHIEGYGKQLFKEAQKHHLEGIMAKRRDSTYESRRTEQWMKIKTEKRQEAIICGFTAPRGARDQFGSLVLGMYKKDVLTFVGHAGTGFDRQSLAAIHRKLMKLKQPECPFAKVPKTNDVVTWVKPELICEVKFSQWTTDKQMRHPVFMGLREDKTPKQVTQEEPKERLTKPQFTHLEKVYWPKAGYTKKDLIQYYTKIAEVMLPYLKDRPESLNRHPEGADKPGFFQKDITQELPPFAQTITVFSESANKDIHYLLCQNKETLLYMANLGCIEINPWNSRVQALENPDYLVIDLDPGENTFQEVVTVAQEVHAVLESACMPSYVKTSGKTGLHIYVPLGAKYDYDDVRAFSEVLVNLVHQRLPEITSVERNPAKRKKKIYLDFLQNREGQTLAAPYSVRPTPEATVSTPLHWKEVTAKLDPRKFTIKTIFRRLKKYGDLWTPTLKQAVDLKKSIACLEKS